MTREEQIGKAAKLPFDSSNPFISGYNIGYKHATWNFIPDADSAYSIYCVNAILTVEEVAAILNVCKATVRRHANSGQLKCFRSPGNQRRFHLSDVLTFKDKQQENIKVEEANR